MMMVGRVVVWRWQSGGGNDGVVEGKKENMVW